MTKKEVEAVDKASSARTPEPLDENDKTKGKQSNSKKVAHNNKSSSPGKKGGTSGVASSSGSLGTDCTTDSSVTVSISKKKETKKREEDPSCPQEMQSLQEQGPPSKKTTPTSDIDNTRTHSSTNGHQDNGSVTNGVRRTPSLRQKCRCLYCCFSCSW